MSEFIKKIEHLSHKQLLLLASVLQEKLIVLQIARRVALARNPEKFLRGFQHLK